MPRGPARIRPSWPASAASAAAAVLLLLSGCTADTASSASSGEVVEVPCGSTSCPTLPTSNWTVSPKPWAIGDWWNYTSTVGGRGAFTHIVTADHGDEWFMETDNAGSAFRNALSDTSYLGPIRKSDLAGSQGPFRIAYLTWPLTDGAQWTTTWDGQTMFLRGRFLPPTQTAQAAYYVEARHENGTHYASYAFGPEVGWFLNATFFDASGHPDFSFALVQHGHQYQGLLARWHLRAVVDWSGPFGGQATDWTVPTNATDVYAEWRFACTSGAIAASVGRAVVYDSSVGHTTQGECPLADAGVGVIGRPSPPPAGSETWEAAVTASPGAAGDFTLRVWVRTLELAQLNTSSVL